MVAKVHNIWQISQKLKAKIDKDLAAIQTSVDHDENEIRPWVKSLISYQQNGLSNFTNSQLVHRLICSIQIMIAIFAAISISWSAAVSLSLFGLRGFLHSIAVGGVIIMSTFSCLLTGLENMIYGLKGVGSMRFQKLRMLEIKLFRSPFIPDPLCANKDPVSGKTQAVINYLNYHEYEKTAQDAVYKTIAQDARIDRQLLSEDGEMPIELRAHMTTVMAADFTRHSFVNQKRLQKNLIDEFTRLSRALDPSNKYNQPDDEFLPNFLTTLYRYSGDNTISDKAITDICDRSRLSSLISKATHKNHAENELIDRSIEIIAAHMLHRIAYFARQHVEELDKQLRKENNKEWCEQTEAQREIRCQRAFRWTVIRYLQRKTQKLSSSITGHYLFMKIFVPLFCILSALFPGGFTILSSSPVTRIVGQLGKGWESMVSLWFWFSGAVNYMASTRKDITKVCAKICNHINRHIVYMRGSLDTLLPRRWMPTYNEGLRLICALSMALASCMFSYRGIKQLLQSPSEAGAQYLISLLFHNVAPWLETMFMPICVTLAAVSAVLSYTNVVKYFSLDRMPAPKFCKNQSTWRSLLSYLINHNIDLNRHPSGKIAKFAGTVVAVFQTMVFYVSASTLMGHTLVMCLMPSVLAVCIAKNRKDIESGFDLFNQWENKLKRTDFKKIFNTWFIQSPSEKARNELETQSDDRDDFAVSSLQTLTSSLSDGQLYSLGSPLRVRRCNSQLSNSCHGYEGYQREMASSNDPQPPASEGRIGRTERYKRHVPHSISTTRVNTTESYDSNENDMSRSRKHNPQTPQRGVTAGNNSPDSISTDIDSSPGSASGEIYFPARAVSSASLSIEAGGAEEQPTTSNIPRRRAGVRNPESTHASTPGCLTDNEEHEEHKHDKKEMHPTLTLLTEELEKHRQATTQVLETASPESAEREQDVEQQRQAPVEQSEVSQVAHDHRSPMEQWLRNDDFTQHENEMSELVRSGRTSPVSLLERLEGLSDSGRGSPIRQRSPNHASSMSLLTRPGPVMMQTQPNYGGFFDNDESLDELSQHTDEPQTRRELVSVVKQ